MNKKLGSLHFTAQGFTLIELIVVLAVIGIMTAGGIAAYSSYNSMQLMDSSQAEIGDMIAVAKSRAVSQVSPPECSNQSLNAYQVVFSKTTNEYQLQVICGGSTFTLQSKQLPSQVTFQPASIDRITFALSSGTVATPGVILLGGYDQTKKITVQGTGNIIAE